MVSLLCKNIEIVFGVIPSHHRCIFTTVFSFYLLIVSIMIKERTRQDIRMIQLADSTDHINKIFEDWNIGVMMGILVMQHSGSCGDDLFVTSSTHAAPVDKNTDVILSAAHTALCYSL